MSSLTSFPKAVNGSIVTTVGAITSFFNAMGIGASDALCVAASAAGGVSNGTVMMAAGKVMHSTINAINNYVAGLPVDVNGALCTEVGAAASFVQGVGITAGGRVAIT